MKTFALLALLSVAAMAGPLKVATYPVRHPVKTTKGAAKGTKGVVKGAYKAGKAILW